MYYFFAGMICAVVGIIYIITGIGYDYEVGILKVFVEPLLYSVPSTSQYYDEARRLLRFLNGFFTISGEYVPKDSILREFIGGSEYD